ncbi:glycosyltransferase [Anaerovibrio sp. RM50]|uniref:glycosyltransferase n=1 Tax=Anaerovibrio sp. RM50 TaxID=1200557 RepID=UPI00048924A1|nr:glycosyltransferase [Anaerovibrio sp. RM50]
MSFMDKNKLYFSFIIPCYKSEKTVGAVLDEITQVTQHTGIDNYEIVCVVDCSPDDVYDTLISLGKENKRIKVIRFAKNFGQHAAMIAGTQHACGDICVFLDDDGQCPLDRLSELISPLYEGYDIAIAAYGKKKQSLFKNAGSLFNEVMANLLIDKPKEIQMGNFMAIKSFVAKEISRYSGPYPYISGLLFRTSAKVVNVPMEDRERMLGGTTYTFKKLVLLWLSSFTAFSIKPLRMATLIGMSASSIGIIMAVVTVVRKILNPQIAMGWSSIIAIMLIIGGLILFVLGIIGEYLGRIYMSINQTPQYVIADKFNFDDSQEI